MLIFIFTNYCTFVFRSSQLFVSLLSKIWITELLITNILLRLKIVVYYFQICLILVWALYNSKVKIDWVSNADTIIWSVCCMSINIAVCVLGWWRCFANNYLHWAAVCTWLLLTLQSKNMFSENIYQTDCSIFWLLTSCW